MDRPVARPARTPPADPALAAADPAADASSAASPQQRRKPRPGWKATIVRYESFAKLRAIQKSTTDPAIDLSYLTDACLQIALELGRDAIVKRALDGLRPVRTSP